MTFGLSLVFDEFGVSPIRTLRARLYGQRQVLVGRGFRIFGLRRIKKSGDGRLRLGIQYFGFLARPEGLLRISPGGTFLAAGTVSIASGCALDVASSGRLTIGAGASLSPNVLLVCADSVSIGGGCAIGWDVSIIDSDFHTIVGRASRSGIDIKSNVWIGAGAQILAGTVVGQGSIVAAGAVVRGDFSDPNCLILGNPARVARRDVTWIR